jgi:glutamate-1-semialdehyde 2,1-aminomutase
MGFNGAQGELGVLPDLTAMGKVIGGGMPIGALGGSAELMESLFDPRDGKSKMAHTGTFNANPMAMVAGAVAMELYDRAAHERLVGLGDRLRAGLREALAVADRPGTVTGSASMVGLFHTEAPMNNYRDVFNLMMTQPAVMQNADTFFRQMLNSGVYLASQGFFVLSTAMTEADIDFVIEQTLQSLRALSAEAA